MSSLPKNWKHDLIKHVESPTTTGIEQIAVVLHETLTLADWQNNDIAMIADALEQLTRLERNR